MKRRANKSDTRCETTWWGLCWRSDNHLDGKRQYVMWHDCKPWLFHTRREAREARDNNYAYIRHRLDLQAEPHGWKVPRVVKVKMTLEVV